MERPTDLTARARIRDAAIAAFAEIGDRATIRDIAKRAGVSPALVQHHFTSKDGLRAACDEFVRSFYAETARDGLAGGAVLDNEFLTRIFAEAPAVLSYIVRGLIDGTAEAERNFDALVDLTEQYLDDSEDRRFRAAVLVALKLGPLLLSHHLDRHLGVATLSPEGLPHVAHALVNLLNPRLGAVPLPDTVIPHHPNRDHQS